MNLRKFCHFIDYAASDCRNTLDLDCICEPLSLRSLADGYASTKPLSFSHIIASNCNLLGGLASCVNGISLIKIFSAKSRNSCRAQTRRLVPISIPGVGRCKTNLLCHDDILIAPLHILLHIISMRKCYLVLAWLTCRFGVLAREQRTHSLFPINVLLL